MDKRDFHSVYLNSKDLVWKLVSKYVVSREDREDLFQEVFLTVHKALPKFRGESAVNTWVYKIAVNTSINHLNKQNRYKWFKQTLNNLRPTKEALQDFSAELHLFKPLEKLNPRQRMVLLLSDVEDMSLDEISELLSVPLGTVKSNLHRAREIIKKEVGENG